MRREKRSGPFCGLDTHREKSKPTLDKVEQRTPTGLPSSDSPSERTGDFIDYRSNVWELVEGTMTLKQQNPS